MGQLRAWFQATRAFSFTASIVPVFVGGAMALYFGGDVAWRLFPLVVICSLLFHAGTNVISEYYDYKKGVDKEHTYGSSRVLVDRLMAPKDTLIEAAIIFLAGCVIGIVFIVFRGWPIFVLGAVGLLGGVFYSAKPVGYKYFALGDLMVFILMGPLMVIGSYFVLTGNYNSNVLFVSLPVGFLVTAILVANNFRDIKYDRLAKVRTVATILGFKGARAEYCLLLAGAYISIAVMAALKVFSPWVFLAFLSIPLAVRNFKVAMKSKPDSPESIAILDVQTAQLHLVFGVLLISSLVLGVIF